MRKRHVAARCWSDALQERLSQIDCELAKDNPDVPYWRAEEAAARTGIDSIQAVAFLDTAIGHMEEQLRILQGRLAIASDQRRAKVDEVAKVVRGAHPGTNLEHFMDIDDPSGYAIW